jgi:hypothetical protein
MRFTFFTRPSRFFALLMLASASAVSGFFVSTIAPTYVTHAADKNSVFSSDKGKLNILLDGKSVGHEEFSIEPAGTNWTTS